MANPTSDLALLRMEIRAIRDRVVADLDAALARIEANLPEPEKDATTRSMKTWTPERWRQFLETGK